MVNTSVWCARITKEDLVEHEIVNLPPLMKPEEGKGEEIGQAAFESRHLADELAGMLDQLEIEEERSVDVNAVVPGKQEVVEGDDDGRGEEERTRKGHEAEQRVEEGAERQTREEEVSCVGIRQKRPSVIVAARSRKRAIEEETNNKDAVMKPCDADVPPSVLEKRRKGNERCKRYRRNK